MTMSLDHAHGVMAAAERREWTIEALALLNAESMRSGETPLIPLRIGAFGGVDVYLKDEAAHPTGSLKHRLARSLFIHALCNADVGPGTPIIEASSGSTAVSEAYFAGIIGVPFIAVVPRSTTREKIDLIERFGGRCQTVDDPTTVVAEARRLASEHGGYFMDQFTNAAQATNWRTDNVAEEIFAQMRNERHPDPEWAVVGAGTGGTSTTIARFARYAGLRTRVVVADPEGSAFYEGWRQQDPDWRTLTPSRIEGIGRTRVEPSFFPRLVDEVVPVPDAASIATMRWISDLLGRRVGASTGTNLWTVIQLVLRMRSTGSVGSIVSLICDEGWRYSSTYYNDEWLQANHIDIAPYTQALEHFQTTGLTLEVPTE
jgi:cysteine synthase